MSFGAVHLKEFLLVFDRFIFDGCLQIWEQFSVPNNTNGCLEIGMSDSTLEISVIIVNWNTRALLRDCIRSVNEQTQCAHEIIVVDNASSDSSAQMVEEEFPSVVLIANDSNRGFAAANNQGIEIATGRYALLLNPDTVVLDGALDKMVHWCDQHQDVGCAGCQVLETPSIVQKTSFADPNPVNVFLTETGMHHVFPFLSLFWETNYPNWDRCDEKDVDVVSGMFMLIPRTVLSEVGLLDEQFFIYAEEADLCRRIRSAGLRCVFTPVARIMHLDGGGKSTSMIKPKMHVELQRSMLNYNRKHNGVVGLICIKTIYLGTKLARLLVFGSLAFITRNSEMTARSHLARSSLLYHLLGLEPK